MSSASKVLLSSVVRSAHQGQSHGGMYLVDLATGDVEQVVDWNDPSISWEGRGGDRGLRGIAFHGERILVAASDEIFVYDRDFRVQGSMRNPYLRHCHEIFVLGDDLYITSTGFDSVLHYDLEAERFVRGYCLRFAGGRSLLRRQRLGLRPLPQLTRFDPERAGGPPAGDTSHVNNVFHDGRTLFVCGTRLGHLLALDDDRLTSWAKVPFGSHNARPFGDGVLMNHTPSEAVCLLDRRGRITASFAVPRYDPDLLEHASLPRDHARQAFARGLAVLGDGRVAGGSSPATVTVYRLDGVDGIERSITLTMDVRNAIHGLEPWPDGT